MSAKSLAIATLAGGIVFFIWSFVWYTALPFGDAGMYELPNDDFVVDVVTDHATHPGIYFSPRGLFAVVNVDPDIPDRTANMGTNLLIQFFDYLAVAFVLSILLFYSTFRTIIARAVIAAIIGLCGSLAIHVSYWNWDGFPTTFTLAALANVVIGFFAAGLVIGWVMRRMSPERAA